MSVRYTLDPIFAYPTFDDQGQDTRQQILDMYKTMDQSREPALLVDNIHSMILKSLSTVCATKLTAPLPSLTGPHPNDTPLSFQKCRKCAGEYVFQLANGGNVTIIASVPRADTPPYKTMSYVWGPPSETPLSVPCVQCGHVSLVPMINAQRFRNLMELGGSGNTVWIDAISINQFDKTDVSASVAVMGAIYRNAMRVSVLLPVSDQAAFECLREIERLAQAILFHRNNFFEGHDITLEDPDTGESIKFLTMVSRLFLENIKRLGEHFHQFAYWSRAWTFQEWTLASDLEIAVEGGSEVSTCLNIKSLVLGAGMLISRYKLLIHQYGEIDLGFSRGHVPAMFNSIKALFPDEDLFLSYEEIDAKKASFQATFPHSGVDQLLGVRSTLAHPPGSTSTTSQSQSNTPQDTPMHLRTRLVLLLSAFASTKREATYEADLVACWASMCNVQYTYDRSDSFATARRKALSALRAQGLIVYDFLPDTTGGMINEADVFRAYAREHAQLNATNQAEFPGAPIFTGRADTVSHLLHSLQMVSLPTQWSTDDDGEHNVRMETVVGVGIAQSIALDGDLEAAMSAFAEKAIYGEMLGIDPGFMFWPVKDVAKIALERVHVERRRMARLVVWQIPFYKSGLHLQPYELHAWAIVPIDIPLEDVTICRESINGTLVLVTKKDGANRLIAYLTISDNFSGTFLIKTDEAGQVDLTLRVPERADMIHPLYTRIAVRQLRGKVRLGESMKSTKLARRVGRFLRRTLISSRLRRRVGT